MTDAVELRNVEVADVPIFYEHQADADASRMAAFPSRDRDAHDAHWRKILASDEGTVRTILYDGVVVGYLASFTLSGEDLVGYWIGRAYWGKGIASRALKQFLSLVAKRPLFARVAKLNVASIRVLEKCGFSVCGTDWVPPSEDGVAVEELIMRLD